jgi:hypothetical protein
MELVGEMMIMEVKGHVGAVPSWWDFDLGIVNVLLEQLH